MTSKKYRSLIFTTSLISVTFVYSPDDVFDSQARDIFGKSYSQRTCLLLDISWRDKVVQYFQNIYGITEMYELKGACKVIYRNSFRKIFVTLLLINQSEQS